MGNETEKLSIIQMFKRRDKRIVFTYALGELSYATYAGFIFQMLNMFMTDIAGVSALAVGYLNVFSRILKICCGPLIGTLFDRRIFKKGKYWPWLIYVPLTAMIVALVQFLLPVIIHGKALVPCVIIAVLCGQFMDGTVFTGYSAVFPAVTDDQHERILASTSKNIARVAGNCFTGMYFPLAIGFFQGKLFKGNAAPAYFCTFVTIVVMATIVYSICAHEVKFSGMEERDIKKEKKEKVPASVMIKQVLTNVPLLMAFCMQICYTFRDGVFSPTLPYYYQHVAGNLSYYSFYQATSLLFSTIAILLTPAICKLFRGAKWAYGGVLTISSICNIFMWVFRGNVVLFTVFLCLTMAIGNIASGLSINFFGAATDYGEWKTGAHIQGLSMSVYQVAIQIANMSGALVVGYALNSMGYTQGMEITQTVKDGITRALVTIPTVMTAIAALLGFLMPLSDKKMAQVQRELAERRGDAAAAAAAESND